MSRRSGSLVALALALGGVAPAAAVEVRLELPVRARIDLAGRRTVALAPFLVVTREGGSEEERLAAGSVDVEREFERYLSKLIRRETPLRLVDSGPLDYPTTDLEILGANRDFWRAAGERWQSDIVLAGSLDFDVQDKSGYRTEEYVSPYDGRVYYRQVLVEQTGFDFDIVLMVFDGRTGERLYFDNFKDFKQFEGESADPLAGMFENLASLENRILNVFTQKSVEATRVLLTD
jgi:hypothetical protein